MKPRSIAVIDYLRGIAALGVAYFHVRVPLWVGWSEIAANSGRYSRAERVLAWLSIPAPFLGSLVMLFFVISGFCVHLPQAGSAESLRFGPYFRRRFFRVYPPYLAAALLSSALALWGFHYESQQRSPIPLLPERATSDGASDVALRGSAGTPGQATASIFMVQNYTGMVAGGTAAEGAQLPTNPALWSLPVEMELYLVYPLMLLLLRRFGPGLMLAAVGFVSILAMAGYEGGMHWLNGNFAKYWIIWCAGAWLAERWARSDLGAPPAWFGLIAMLSFGASLYRDVQKLDPALSHFSYGLFYFWVVWLLLAKPALWERAPGMVARGLGWLGKVSYSFYLLHFPLFFLLGAGWVALFGAKPANFLIPLAACVLVLPVVALFYRFVEAPSHRLAKRMGRVGGLR